MTDVITVEKTHPVTGKRKKCQVFLNQFGRDNHGYRFEGERVMYTQEELDLMTPHESG